MLGSPMNSPIQAPGSPASSSLYLPSFLLGDTNTVRTIFYYQFETYITLLVFVSKISACKDQRNESSR